MDKFLEKSENLKKLTKNIVILYHGDCPDGFGAAWASWKKFGDGAEYIGVHHGDNPPDGLKDKEIYFLDFVYDKTVMEKLKSQNKKLIIIDHHPKAQYLSNLSADMSFDTNRSGAVLAWNYFHPNRAVPFILSCVQDRDLWRWIVQDSKEVLMYLDIFERDFQVWDDIIEKVDKQTSVKKEFIDNGKLLLRQWLSLCDNMIRSDSLLVKFEGYKTYAVNASSVFANDIANTLIQKLSPMAIIWHQDKDGKINVSLRSDGSVDVSELAGRYGGGGHKRSSAFRLKYGEEAPWRKI